MDEIVRNFSHTPKPASEGLIIAYPATGPHESYAVLHLDNCSHTFKRSTRESIPWDGVFSADDYYVVAPCARLKG